ncbi:hypothetical protein HY497_01715 [Candidatus Woesearchaeota archaeon]|nr:hypothetical protein [Candidatus Woesearchaeota archaeon]
MIKMRRLALAFLLILLLPSAMAASTIEIVPIKDRILFGEKAEFDVTVTNIREDQSQTYTISTTASGIEWGVQTKPLGDSSFVLNPNTEKKVRVTIEPVEKFSPGVYVINLVVTTKQGEKYSKPLKVFMGPNDPKEYLPSLRAIVDMSDRIDPKETQSVKISVENLNPLDLTGMTLDSAGELPILDVAREIDLEPGPGTQKTIEFTFKLPDTQQPKEYFIYFQFKKDDEILKIVEKRVEVLPLTPAFAPKIEEQKSFLKTSRKVTFSNSGNVRNTQVATLDVGSIARLFTITDPDARTVRDKEGKRVLGWELEIGAGESVTVYASTNYRVPIAALLIIVVAWALYLLYRNPLAVSKVASNVMLHEGGVSGLKVTLAVKNMSNDVLKEIEIIDQIPGIANMENNVEMGTMKHTHILRGKRGSTFVKWKLSELDGKEERLITYKIKSKLNVVGNFQLPRAKATFITAAGKKRTSYSNTFRVSTGE